MARRTDVQAIMSGLKSVQEGFELAQMRKERKEDKQWRREQREADVEWRKERAKEQDERYYKNLERQINERKATNSRLAEEAKARRERHKDNIAIRKASFELQKKAAATKEQRDMIELEQKATELEEKKRESFRKAFDDPKPSDLMRVEDMYKEEINKLKAGLPPEMAKYVQDDPAIRAKYDEMIKPIKQSIKDKQDLADMEKELKQYQLDEKRIGGGSSVTTKTDFGSETKSLSGKETIKTQSRRLWDTFTKNIDTKKLSPEQKKAVEYAKAGIRSTDSDTRADAYRDLYDILETQRPMIKPWYSSKARPDEDWQHPFDPEEDE